MLVLSREPGSSVLFNEDTLLTITELERDRVKMQVSREPSREVLARHRLKKNESVILEELNVEVYVVDIRVEGGRATKVRLGIQAPREMSVHRHEVYEAIRREQQTS